MGGRILIIFVNGAYMDPSSVPGKLIHDMMCNDPDQMYLEELRQRARFLKETSEDMIKMSNSWTELLEKESAKVTAEVTAKISEEYLLQLMSNLHLDLNTSMDALGILDPEERQRLTVKLQPVNG